SSAPIDFDKQCCVFISDTQQLCSRSITCKIHSTTSKRAVIGRSQQFDVLLLE
ncbi:SCA7 domain-containing protein, partial [Blyttiomyces helicus]